MLARGQYIVQSFDTNGALSDTDSKCRRAFKTTPIVRHCLTTGSNADDVFHNPIDNYSLARLLR